MRALTALALVACIAAAFGYIARGGPRPELAAQASLSAGDALAAAQEVIGASRADAPPEEETAARFYQYEDEHGRSHFVQSLGDVPASARANAKTIEIDSGRFIRDERAPARRARGGANETKGAKPLARREPALGAGHDVVVYTTSWCGWCRKTIAWLDAKGIDYENRDIESDDVFRDELIEKTGGTSIPVVEIDGEIVRGFNPGTMAELLGS